MSIGSVSTQYLGTAMLPAVTQAQSQLTQLEVETSTGQYADLGLQLGSQNGYELSLKNRYQLLQTLTTDNGLATTNLSNAQSALDAIRTGAQTALQSVASLTPGSDTGATLRTLGASSLQSLIGLTNTTSGEQYVLGGINSSTPPLANYFSTPPSSAQTAVDQAFQTAFGFPPTDPAAAAVSPAAMQAFLAGPFAAEFTGSNWTNNWSSASSTNASAEIAPGETIDTSSNANESGFAQLAEAYTMLNEFGGPPFGGATQQVVASTAASLITLGVSSMISTEAGIGSALSEVAAASSAMSSQMTILQTQIGDLDNVDPNTVATQLNTLTTQIETAYQLTAQLQKLSLAQYLPT